MNRREDKPRFSPPALGGASLLVIFAVLALTVFALLSLSTVRESSRLGDASAKAVTDYYAADCQAQKVLSCLRKGAPLPDGIAVETNTTYSGATVYSYTCPISDTQELQVEILLESDSYTILRWQAAPVGDWEYDDGIDLWDMEIF